MSDNTERLGEDDLFIQRDEEGEVLPVEKEVPYLGKTAKITPMPYGEVQRQMGDVGDGDMIEGETVAEILREHVIEPDLSEINAEDLDERMKAIVPQALLLAVFEASGVEGDLVENAQGEPELELQSGN